MSPKPSFSTLFFVGLSILVAAVVGYLDQHNDEVWAALILILPTTFVLGFIRPRYGWLWALIIGGSVPMAALIGWGLGYTPSCHPGIICPPPNIRAAEGMIAWVPAFIGAYTGAILRWLISLTTNAKPSNG